MKFIPTTLGAVLLSTVIPTSHGDGGETTCNKNGGSAMSYDGACDSRNYTWTDQCIVEEKDGQCITTATECGCQWFGDDGFSSAIGSGSIEGCDNACVTITDDIPEGGSCQKTGESMSFEGSCDSRGYIYTSNSNFKEDVDISTNAVTCSISMNSCGCLWWEHDSVDTAALHSKSCTDPCAVHGYPALPSSAPLFELTVKALGVAFMTAWHVL